MLAPNGDLDSVDRLAMINLVIFSP